MIHQLLAILCVVGLLACGERRTSPTQPGAECSDPIPITHVANAIPNSYIIEFRTGFDSVSETARLEAKYGFHGGYLVFGERIGVKHTGAPTEDQPESFVAVLDEGALGENQLVRATAGEVPILLVHTSGRIFALGEICTHLGGPLAEGALEGMSVRCPWHGSRFCLENGSVLESPATFSERVFDVRMQGGKIEVRASGT